jgi:hypothetical protein
VDDQAARKAALAFEKAERQRETERRKEEATSRQQLKHARVSNIDHRRSKKGCMPWRACAASKIENSLRDKHPREETF